MLQLGDIQKRLDPERKGRLSFQELMVSLHRCAVESNISDRASTLQEILTTIDSIGVKSVSNIDEQ